jgi:teichuronic acid biosynthesis glycosyltransferase TuaG
MRKQSPLVSIVVPVYNAEIFLTDTVETVRSQSYSNWELIFIDDCSTDRSVELIKQVQRMDDRIKLIQLVQNSGAAIARNAGTKKAKGKYIAFLDADDLWDMDKLNKQVKFMSSNNYSFSFTGYFFADSKGKPIGRKVNMPAKVNYNQILRNPIIWTSTVMLDTEQIQRTTMLMPNIRRGQDAATWLKIMKTVNNAYGMSEALSYYRRTKQSLSANKLIAIKRTWHLYRKVENLSLLKSITVFIFYGYNAVRKRI